MTKRRKAREVALQFLYQLDLQGEVDPSPHSAEFWARHPLDDDLREFAQELVGGTKSAQTKIDDIIVRYTEHWDLDRMAVVDRNILRLAVYELSFRAETPPKVVINEAIEVAKRFGTAESPAFVNGLLDRISQELSRS